MIKTYFHHEIFGNGFQLREVEENWVHPKDQNGEFIQLESNAAPLEHMNSYDREEKIWNLGYIYVIHIEWMFLTLKFLTN